jgi:chromosome segregation ATPase
MHRELEARLAEARSGKRPIALAELEQLYTNGCAEILELEADAVRIKRRISELRAQLRHIRTAIDWLQTEDAAGATDDVTR